MAGYPTGTVVLRRGWYLKSRSQLGWRHEWTRAVAQHGSQLPDFQPIPPHRVKEVPNCWLIIHPGWVAIAARSGPKVTTRDDYRSGLHPCGRTSRLARYDRDRRGLITKEERHYAGTKRQRAWPPGPRFAESSLQQSHGARRSHRLRAGSGADLAVDAFQVGLNGILRDINLCCDLTAAQV